MSLSVNQLYQMMWFNLLPSHVPIQITIITACGRSAAALQSHRTDHFVQITISSLTAVTK